MGSLSIQRTGEISRLFERLVINPEWHGIAARNEAARQPVGGLGDEASGPTNTDQRAFQERGRSEFRPGYSYSDSGQEKHQDALGEIPPQPQLAHIRPEDFSEVGRALALLRQAAECGLMPDDGERSRMLWLTAIEKARTVGAKNPAGLLLFLVKNRKWDYLSQGHEDAARSRLREHYLAERTSPPLLVPGPVSRETRDEIPESSRLSKDAFLLQAVRTRGLRNLDAAFPPLQAAGWDRQRFIAARAELEKRNPVTTNAAVTAEMENRPAAAVAVNVP